MTTDPDTRRDPRQSRFVLHPHRSLGPSGFLILMSVLGVVSFIMGVVFVSIGAWPVMGFFGLDVALIYWAFKRNYRDGRMYEVVDIDPEVLKLTRVHASGRSEAFEFNSHWARIRLTTDRPDGRTSLRLGAQGLDVLFATFLNDDERRALADALTGALLASRRAAGI